MARSRSITVGVGLAFSLAFALIAPAAIADGGDGGAGDLGGGGPCGAVTIKGCCEGQILRYCAGGVLKGEDCGKDPSCGWSASKAFYACGTSGASDPTGKHPKTCPALVDAGVDGASVDGPAADAAPMDGAVDGAEAGANDAADADGGSDGIIWKPPDQGRDVLAAADARRDGGQGGGETSGGCGCRAGSGDASAGTLLLSLVVLGFGLARVTRRTR